eukprot:jgi/Mesvir1/13308/Mv04545-RA.1
MKPTGSHAAGAVAAASQVTHAQKAVLQRRLAGKPREEDFCLVQEQLPPLKSGEVLLETLWLSVDPVQRIAMLLAGVLISSPLGTLLFPGGFVPGSPGLCRVAAVGQGEPVPGVTVGDTVLVSVGWRSHTILRSKKAAQLHRKKVATPSPSLLGVQGSAGRAAYFGMMRIGRPAPGDTVVVSGAAGAVGSVAGQLAHLLAPGCRVVGIAGGPAKCQAVVGTCGFDACVDYKQPDFADALARACPNGVDLYFDNVGGEVSRTVAHVLNRDARVPVCGFISQYNCVPSPFSPRFILQTLAANVRAASSRLGPPGEMILGMPLSSLLLSISWLLRRLPSQPVPPTIYENIQQGAGYPPALGKTFRFFSLAEYGAELAEADAALARWVGEGKLKSMESVVEGLESMPRAFVGLFEGANMGKQLVKVRK